MHRVESQLSCSSSAVVPFTANNHRLSRTALTAPMHAGERRHRFGPRWTLGERIIARAGDDNEELPWERKERLQDLADKGPKDLPFAVYLVASAIVAIAAVGSIFEIINQNSIFGVVPPSSPLWLPILGTFGLTGLPSAGFLFFKAITTANADADRQNKADGY